MGNWPEAVREYEEKRKRGWNLNVDDTLSKADAAIAALKDMVERAEQWARGAADNEDDAYAAKHKTEAEVRAQAKLLNQLAAEVKRLKGAERALARVMAENTANYARAEKAEAELAQVWQRLIDELAKNALTPTGRERLERAEAEVERLKWMLWKALEYHAPRTHGLVNGTAVEQAIADLAARYEKEQP